MAAHPTPSTIRGEDLAALLVGALSEAQVAARNGVPVEQVHASRAQAVALLEGLQGSPRRRTWRPSLAVAALGGVGLLLVGGVALAQVTCTAQRPGLVAFCANQPALAKDINDNFNQLNDWLVQKVGAVGSSNLTVGGALGVTGAATMGSGLLVTGASTLDGGLAVTGTAAITGSTTIGGNLDVVGALLPDFDSGWVAAPGDMDTQLTHNLGVLPGRISIWWRSGANGFVNPVSTYDEGSFNVNGPVVGVSATVLKYRTKQHAFSYYRYRADGTYEEGVLSGTAGEYRFLLWK